MNKAVGTDNNRERLIATARRKQVSDLLATGMSQTEIAKQMGISRTRVHQLFRQALARAEHDAVDQYRTSQLAKLEMLRAKLEKILNTRHVAYSQGRVVRPQKWNQDLAKWVDDPEAEPYEDTAPLIAAVNAYRGLLEREAKLTGADMPVKVDAKVQAVVVSINGVDPSQLV